MCFYQRVSRMRTLQVNNSNAFLPSRYSSEYAQLAPLAESARRTRVKGIEGAIGSQGLTSCGRADRLGVRKHTCNTLCVIDPRVSGSCGLLSIIPQFVCCTTSLHTRDYSGQVLG